MGGRPLRGGADRNRRLPHTVRECLGSPPARGRGSKQPGEQVIDPTTGRRPLRGGADRNSAQGCHRKSPTVAPCAGARIETHITTSQSEERRGRPLRGGADRNCSRCYAVRYRWVAPCAGARIETADWTRLTGKASVAPCAGARIETSGPRSGPQGVWSPPARGRGSKLRRCEDLHDRAESPPARGRGSKPVQDGIEARPSLSPPARGRGSKPRLCRRDRWPRWSPPARGRGSKQTVLEDADTFDWSPPARGRGSKHFTHRPAPYGHGVAPCAGARIETP